MNTSPIQLTSTANAAADAASKGRAADPGNAETSFRDVLKSEVAERRRGEADASSAAGKSEKAATSAQAGKSSESVESSREKDEAEQVATQANQQDMAQFLVLTSQYVQPPANPDAPSADLAAEASMAAVGTTVSADASLTAVGTAVPADAARAGANVAGLLPQQNSPAPAGLQDGRSPSADMQKGSEKADFAAEFDRAGTTALPHAGASSEKSIQPEGASSQALAANVQIIETGDVQQPQANSFIALQQAGIEQMEKTVAQAGDRIAPRVATPAWNQAIGQKVIWMAGNDQQSASLSLNPPDLGPLQVVIRVSESTATANFVSAHPEVRQALEAAMPRLREMLGEAGIQLGQAHVGAGTSGEYGPRAQQMSQTPNTAEVSYALQPDMPQPAQVIRRGLVDTFA